jgi:hypothetical protein
VIARAALLQIGHGKAIAGRFILEGAEAFAGVLTEASVENIPSAGWQSRPDGAIE